MAEQKSKKGFFGKFLDVLSGKPNSPDSETTKPEEQGDFAPEKQEPADLGFVKKFTETGGRFLYCEDETEAYTYIRQIMAESGLHEVFCPNDNLSSILRKAEVFPTTNRSEADAYCCDCEYLVAFVGGILVSDNQLKGIRLEDLPETFIIIARASQITENLSTALAGIRIKYKNSLPGQIRTIRGKTNIEGEAPGEGTISKKETYLLLLEDQL